jgi:putative glutathione S-transferase
MSALSNMSAAELPSSWHAGPEDSFHGKITPEGPFEPEQGRYHLYIGLFCPFAHRANIIFQLKQLQKYAEIETSITKPYPKGDENGWPGWQFNVKDAVPYEGATEDKLYGSKYMHELYFKADKDYKGRYSVPVLWDKKLNTIVNNESTELLRDLQTAFNDLIPTELQSISLYPEPLRAEIDALNDQLQGTLNTGVYKVGFSPDQASYEKAIPAVFASLNKLERLASKNSGPYLLGPHLTEVDVRTYVTLIRFDVVYVQHFKCNLGMLRYSYPVLYNWLKGLYWDHGAFRETTNFRHIKENYTKSHYDINPKAITPLGPWPDIDRRVEKDWTKIAPGRIDMPIVMEFEKTLR